MKISQKLIVLVLITSLIPLIGVGLFSYTETTKALNKQIRVQIEATADRQFKAAEVINESLNAQLVSFSNRVQLRVLLKDYNQTGGADTKIKIDQTLNSILNDEQSFLNIYITNSEGKVVASTDTSADGSDYAKTEEFIAGKKMESSTGYVGKDAQGVLRQRLVTPLRLNDTFLGVAVITSQLDRYSILTTDYSGLGSTGESYLLRKTADNRHQYITDLRFKQNALLQINVAGPDSNKDYRNNTVLKTKRTLSNGWVLVTKIDANEVDAPVAALRKAIILIILTTLVVVVLLAGYISRKITHPINTFIETVKQIRQGSLKARVQLDSTDEIGLLGTAFNEMADHLAESQAHLLGSITGLKQGFIMVDQHGTVTLVNRAAQDMLKFSNDVVKNKSSVKNIMHDVTGVNIQEVLDLCLKGKYIDVSNIHFEGAILRMFLSPVAVDDTINSAVILIVDETEAHILQRSRDEFFSIASHELRTPLTAIRGNTSMIKQYFPEQLKDPVMAEMIGDIHDSSIRLIDIVNDFLDVSRLEQGKIKFDYEVFGVSEIIEKVVYETEAVANEKHTNIILDKKLDVFPDVYADKNRIKQIMYNLLGNALKFTENGYITITTTVDAGLLKVIVTDTGPGISEPGQKLLFHKFQQAGDSLLTRDSSRSTGLGLYISKLLTEKMGGSITLEHSELGKGSAFSFSIPIATEENKKVAAKAKVIPKV